MVYGGTISVCKEPTTGPYRNCIAGSSQSLTGSSSQRDISDRGRIYPVFSRCMGQCAMVLVSEFERIRLARCDAGQNSGAIRTYLAGPVSRTFRPARGQRRLDGLERWKMPEILAFLPTLMHLSLGNVLSTWHCRQSRGADNRMRVQPLIDSNVILRLATRFMACPSQDPKIKLTGITSLEAASLYACALTFVMSCASDQVYVASELKRVTGTAPDRRPILMDSGSSCLHDSDITRTNSNVAAFGAACMGIWREFWTQVEWIWFKAPITTSYNLLKKYSEGELTLHSSAVVALVKRIALEAARWFDLRYAHDRGHVVMVLVKLVSRTSLHFL
ncbi:hypothetical protein AG1IA_05262 [Rhizoctonia solani AG-1 IA]|uniref:DUF6535 domain-containing protein n=1 Tax=Thanatephorus cucumeris (strain AG1-IA) TaxID=983506 RepID=L8WWI5_THACA|nr:hypothetical protein AG1IA_05262 [Rhizoctonia solani AG-1 IA]